MSAIASPARVTADSAAAMKDRGPGNRRSSEEWDRNTLRAGRSLGTPLSIPAASGIPVRTPFEDRPLSVTGSTRPTATRVTPPLDLVTAERAAAWACTARGTSAILVRVDEPGSAPATDDVAVVAVAAIHSGDSAALSRILAQRPELATARLVDPRGVTRTLLHVVTDWPGYFPDGPRTVEQLLAAG